MQVIILCGGLGTRLRTVVSDVPKPMAPINGKPFMQIQVDELINSGATKIIFAVGYKKEIIKDFFGDNYRGVELVYSEEDYPLKTGGAIKKALRYIDDDCAIVVNGDCYTKVNYDEIQKLFRETNATEVMTGKPMHNFDRFGNIVPGEDNVTVVDFIEKQPTEFGYINLGIYAVKKNLFDEYALELGDSFSHEVDFISKHLHDCKFCLYPYDGYFIDIGIPEDYFAFCDYMKRLN